MKKVNEILSPASCFNKALAEEMLFVLLARDAAAPVAIRAWCSERIRIGENNCGDAQILEALACADAMEAQREGIIK